MNRLQAMRVFATIVDRRSLSAASEALGISLPTVSRMLSALERDLGVRLIARTTRGLTETDAGRLYYRRCLTILDEIREAESAVQSHAKAPAGELRVTAPVTFGRYHVAPSMAQFLERYPRLSFYLLLSDHCESLSEQRLDVAVRVAALEKETVTARRLGYVQRAVVGSKEYFDIHPMPNHPSDLAGHNCMHFTHYLRADEWSFQEQGRKISVRVNGRMRTNNQEALVDAVLPERDSPYYQPGWFRMRLIATDCIVYWLSLKHRERRSTLSSLLMGLRRARCGLLSSSLVSYIEHRGF